MPAWAPSRIKNGAQLRVPSTPRCVPGKKRPPRSPPKTRYGHPRLSGSVGKTCPVMHPGPGKTPVPVRPMRPDGPPAYHCNHWHPVTGTRFRRLQVIDKQGKA